MDSVEILAETAAQFDAAALRWPTLDHALLLRHPDSADDARRSLDTDAGRMLAAWLLGLEDTAGILAVDEFPPKSLSVFLCDPIDSATRYGWHAASREFARLASIAADRVCLGKLWPRSVDGNGRPLRERPEFRPRFARAGFAATFMPWPAVGVLEPAAAGCDWQDWLEHLHASHSVPRHSQVSSTGVAYDVRRLPLQRLLRQSAFAAREGADAFPGVLARYRATCERMRRGAVEVGTPPLCEVEVTTTADSGEAPATTRRRGRTSTIGRDLAILDRYDRERRLFASDAEFAKHAGCEASTLRKALARARNHREKNPGE